MANVANRGVIALDVPRRTGAEMATSQALVRWHRELEDEGFEVHALPYTAYESPTEDQSRETAAYSHIARTATILLPEAAGLVIVNPEGMVMELDSSVLRHMGSAASLGVLIFMASPFEEVALAGERPDTEVIYMSKGINTIIDRLGGEQ